MKNFMVIAFVLAMPMDKQSDKQSDNIFSSRVAMQVAECYQIEFENVFK
jgi:hypothetical protein